MSDVNPHPTARQHPGLLGVLIAVQERFRGIRGQNAASALTLSLLTELFPHVMQVSYINPLFASLLGGLLLLLLPRLENTDIMPQNDDD